MSNGERIRAVNPIDYLIYLRKLRTKGIKEILESHTGFVRIKPDHPAYDAAMEIIKLCEAELTDRGELDG